jgi:hypothetical protein
MTYVANGLVIVWLVGFLFLFGYGFNLSRLVSNNLIPGRTYRNAADYFLWRAWRSRPGFFSIAVHSADLTELGKKYHKRAIRIDWLILIWMIGGFLVVVWASTYWTA